MPAFSTQKDLDKFLFSLIKYIPDLTQLSLKLPQNYLSSRIPLNLSELFSGITSIKTLKTFEFFHKFEAYTDPIVPTDSCFSFSNFTFVKINTRIAENFHTDFLLQTFMLPQESSEIKRDFHLGTFCLTSVNKLSELIKTLNRVIPEWRMMKVHVEAELVIDLLEDIEKISGDPVHLKNTEMILNIIFKGEVLAKEEIRNCQRILKNSRFNIVQQGSRKDWKYIVTIALPAIQIWNH